MTFVLNGFSQDGEFRVFSFQGIAADHARTTFRVRIHLALSRQYGIRIQDLPILCKALLERSGEPPSSRNTTFTERLMSEYAARAAARSSASQAAAHRKSSAVKLGAAWRTPHDQQ